MFLKGDRMKKLIIVYLGLLSFMGAYSWDIVVENQMNNDMACQILPRIDIGGHTTVDTMKLSMIKVAAKQILHYQLPVWQENLNPYIVFVITPEQKIMSWPVQLKDHSQLRCVSEDNNQINLYSRIGDESWVKIEKRS